MSVTLQFAADPEVVEEPHVLSTHVDVVVHYRDSGSEKLLGARFGGVAIRPLNYQQFYHVDRVVLPLLEGPEEFFFNFLLGQLGKPFDDSVVDFDRDWRDNESWTSSELVAAALEHCGFFPHLLSPPLNIITPVDLWLAISARTPINVR